MKKIFKIIITCFVFSLMIAPSFAKKIVIKESPFASLIKSSALDKTSTIAMSIKDAKSGNIVYEYNQDKLLHPASTLKMFSVPAALSVLGEDYSFKTQLYVDNSNNLYVKLGADPLLTSANLKNLAKDLRAQGIKNINNIYIDDSIIDNVEWGTGWMWDDETNPHMAKFSAYNLDENLLKITVSKDEAGVSKFQVGNMYPVAVLNKVAGSKVSKVEVNRYNWYSPDIIELKGCVDTPVIVSVPINNMRRYFTYKLAEYLTSNHIKYMSENFTSANVPKDAKLVAETSHSINDVLPLVLKNSNNRAAETLCKVAASKSNNSTGTNELSAKLIKDFYISNGVKSESVLFADASGASRNNLLSVNWMTSSLNSLYALKSFDYIKSNMAQPGDGTMLNRLYDLRGNVWLKTGTLSNISGLTGYVKAKNEKMYSVAILIQNFGNSQTEAKQLEDNIINLIYQL